jgi:hypothetical protein
MACVGCSHSRSRLTESVTMNINLKILFADGTEKSVSALAADLVAFETKFDLSIAQLEKSVRLTHLLFIGWHVEKRTGGTKDEFEKWVELVSTISADDTKK